VDVNGRDVLAAAVFFLVRQLTYSSIGGQEQTRLRSPKALSTRDTAGQNFRSRTHGAGNAAFSRE
jgi:hypothetical protein